LTADEANGPRAEAAMASPGCRAEAVASHLSRGFSEKRVTFDPSDPDANNLTVSRGYTVVHGSMMSGGVPGRTPRLPGPSSLPDRPRPAPTRLRVLSRCFLMRSLPMELAEWTAADTLGEFSANSHSFRLRE
jgi:hypothetical protein